MPRVFVDTQSVLNLLLSGMTTLPNLEQQVMFMRRTLISRPNGERVLRMVDLGIKCRSLKEHEKQVDELIDNIKISGTERDDIYTISFSSPNPKLGKDVVQSLLTIFVEGSFGGKKQDADKAVQFIGQIGSDGVGLASIGKANPELDERIQAVQKQLDAARMQYTEAHPDIVGGRHLLAQLEEKKREDARNAKPSGDPGANYSPMLQQLKVALSEAEARR